MDRAANKSKELRSKEGGWGGARSPISEGGWAGLLFAIFSLQPLLSTSYLHSHSPFKSHPGAQRKVRFSVEFAKIKDACKFAAEKIRQVFEQRSAKWVNEVVKSSRMV